MKKITKKLANVALAATILGTGTVATLVSDAPQAQAASVVDDFNGLNAYSAGIFNLKQEVMVEGRSYKTGDTIYYGTELYDGSTFKHLKVYQIKDGSTMQRWKTYTPSTMDKHYLSQGVSIIEVYDTITTAYPTGTYIAIATYDNQQTRSFLFDITKK